MKVKIRLQNQGVRNHPYWFIVIQPHNRNPKGRYIERVGYWIPRKTQTVDRSLIINKHRMRYWLGVGAQPTFRVHKILEKFNFLPKHPVPLGSHYTYEKPEKEYQMSVFKHRAPQRNGELFYYKQQIAEQMIIIERKKRLQQEAMANFGETGAAVPHLEEIKTEEIESEEADIFERKKTFESLLQKFEKHKKENAHLRGNDLRYNIYMRKLQKLTRMDLGLDVEAYKDYINNLKKFAHLNHDFEIFARDYLSLDDDLNFKTMVQIKGREQNKDKPFTEKAKFELSAALIHDTLRKLRRQHCSFLNKKDNVVLQEFVDNMRTYLENFDVYSLTRYMYDRRQREIKERESRKNLNIEKVTEAQLKEANVSRREFDFIKALYEFDKYIFFKKEMVHSTSPHVHIVDVSKYDKIPKDIKEILYRPQKLKKLIDGYWLINEVVTQKQREENVYDKKHRQQFHARYPPKTPEELAWIDKINDKIVQLIEEDRAEYEKELLENQNVSIDEVTSVESSGNTGIYFKGDFREKLDAYNRLTEEEKSQLPVKDEIDQMDINELIKNAFPKNYDDPEYVMEKLKEYYSLNAAKVFLGADGGYSLRRYKKILLREIKKRQEDEQERKDYYAKKEALQQEVTDSEAEPIPTSDSEEPVSADGTNEDAAETASTLDSGKIESLSVNADSDDSDIEEEWITMDDASFLKIVEEMLEMKNLQTEEDYQNYFNEKIQDKWNKARVKKLRKPIDVHELRDPHHWLKEPQPIESRFTNEWDIDDEDHHRMRDEREKTVGRYPIGWRHLENFENYRVENPQSNVNEYINELHRQCEFHEFKQILTTAFLTQAQDPYFKWKNKLPGSGHDIDPRNYNELTPEQFVETSDFEEFLRQEFQQTSQAYLLDRQWYKLIDCLEEVSDYWNYGKNITEQTPYNSYVPTRGHLIPKPDLNSGFDDEEGYRFGVSRMSLHQIPNPLKSYNSHPTPHVVRRIAPEDRAPHKFIKNRRLSRGINLPSFTTFSTSNRPVNPVWYQSRVSHNMLNMFGTPYNPSK